MARAAYIIFCSSYLQADFVRARDEGDGARMLYVAEEEKNNAKELYRLMSASNLIGFEAANHYYYSKSQLMEKVINCEFVKDSLKN